VGLSHKYNVDVDSGIISLALLDDDLNITVCTVAGLSVIELL
jgi:hypothetical protein